MYTKYKRLTKDGLTFIKRLGYIDINNGDVHRTIQIKILNAFGDVLYSVNLRDLDGMYIHQDDLIFLKREYIEYFV